MSYSVAHQPSVSSWLAPVSTRSRHFSSSRRQVALRWYSPGHREVATTAFDDFVHGGQSRRPALFAAGLLGLSVGVPVILAGRRVKRKCRFKATCPVALAALPEAEPAAGQPVVPVDPAALQEAEPAAEPPVVAPLPADIVTPVVEPVATVEPVPAHPASVPPATDQPHVVQPAVADQPADQPVAGHPSEEPDVGDPASVIANSEASPSGASLGRSALSVEQGLLSKGLDQDGNGENPLLSGANISAESGERSALSVEQGLPSEDPDEDQAGENPLLGVDYDPSQRPMASVPPAQLGEMRSKSSPEDLPIRRQRAEIEEAIASQRVVVLVGGTGCGKSTQVPQMILQEAADLQKPCSILVTQPRRMAATSLARRVAHELDLSMGKEIGYRIRGEAQPGTHCSFVTAGYLLAWFTVDPAAFESVTHIILDEAHIRTSDMELLLLLVRLLMRLYKGPTLILMSATLQTSAYINYFKEFSETPLKPIFVGGRLFPVEVLHLDDLAEGAAPQGFPLPPAIRTQAKAALKELWPNKIMQAETAKPGTANAMVKASVYQDIRNLALKIIPEVAEGGSTILVFIPGYADLVRLHSWLYWNLPQAVSVNMGVVPPKPDQLANIDEETLEAEDFNSIPAAGVPKEQKYTRKEQAEVEEQDASGRQEGSQAGRAMKFAIFALHSQVPGEDQDLVFETPPPDTCHVVLATTIAESSLTLPRVVGVIDFCVHKTAVGDKSQLSRLCTEWCARSAATQREGRAGRTRPGWCFRMVPKLFFESHMPEWDTPEILRTPLTQLFLQAKGITDGLKRVVKDDAETAQRLGIEAMSPGRLLMQLPAPPSSEAVQAAVRQLATVGALESESEFAEVTVLGRIALWLPLNINLGRLVWLGGLWGCPAEAVVLAAACSCGTSPFNQPSRLAFMDNGQFLPQLRNAADSRRFFDGGHMSEPIANLRLFCNWLRRLAMTPPRSNHTSRWFRATASLAEDVAIDTQRMSVFVGYVADVAIRARDMCSDARGEDECRVRKDLHGLICLLRRPDLSYNEQKLKANDKDVPKLGEVFRASATKLYALLAAAFSDTVMVGSNRYGEKPLAAMWTAMDQLSADGGSSQDAILIPMPSSQESRQRLKNDKDVRQTVAAICGAEPQEVAVTPMYMACKFDVGEELQGPSLAKMRRGTAMENGLMAVERPRLNDISPIARLCHMASGGAKNYMIEDMLLARAVTPYEIEFSLQNASLSEERKVIALLGEQNPLGYASHVTSPEALGSDHFGCVAAGLTIVESGTAVRGFCASLLSAEQLIFALTTISPSSLNLSLGFGQGPGGSAEGARAALTGMRFQTRARSVLFKRHVPGLESIKKVNAVRSIVMESLVSIPEHNGTGQEILLWEDEEAVAAIEDLVRLVDGAHASDDTLGRPTAQAEHPVVWVNIKSKITSEKKSKGKQTAPDIQALRPLELVKTIESTVARKTSENLDKVTHRHECPDCGDRFDDWRACLEHYELTGHLDVSTPEAVRQAREKSHPVRYRCLECGIGFSCWDDCKQHLDESNHLPFADSKTQAQLCMPKSAAAAEEDVADENKDLDEQSNLGFFSSLNSRQYSALASRKAALRPADAASKKPQRATKNETQKKQGATSTSSKTSTSALVAKDFASLKKDSSKQSVVTSQPKSVEVELSQAVQAVKRIQQDTPDGRRQWDVFCQAQAGGRKSPTMDVARFDLASLKTFLREWSKPISKPIAEAPKPAPAAKMVVPDPVQAKVPQTTVLPTLPPNLVGRTFLNIFSPAGIDSKALRSATRKVAAEAKDPKGSLQMIIQKYKSYKKIAAKKDDILYKCELLPGDALLHMVELQLTSMGLDKGTGAVVTFRSDTACATKKEAEYLAARAALRGIADIMTSAS
mmetsp:Transcript_78885/g.142280  ORF Transcript_78885/g.142280 Transcript_78885/m.142280 type:complete len:1880 (+) Transcript_78885:103-5742(+)|eukprot:CAMPEP_0115056540 /NCGR_PEP_ID=MMETSP0227-20121206/5249_1 /TAXON_ID=89957 /ORGANISM="Polarella glacialis, Strain CCMP 1383" /LENGTH=1879 /DNA_ID=CAMNT_0002441223 /DNA_START=99 /DNA_END=5738 /DNA_ORIENTATION=-